MIRSIHAVLLTVRRPSRSSQYQLISPLSISPNPGFKVADGFFMSRLPHRVALQSSVVLQMFPFGTKRSSIGRSKSESWGSAYRRNSDKLLKFKHYGGAKKDWRKEGDSSPIARKTTHFPPTARPGTLPAILRAILSTILAAWEPVRRRKGRMPATRRAASASRGRGRGRRAENPCLHRRQAKPPQGACHSRLPYPGVFRMPPVSDRLCLPSFGNR